MHIICQSSYWIFFSIFPLENEIAAESVIPFLRDPRIHVEIRDCVHLHFPSSTKPQSRSVPAIQVLHSSFRQGRWEVKCQITAEYLQVGT